jgi:glycolate oxidase
LPEFVVLPNGTEETQKVVKICNRYRVPFIPLGSSQWSIATAPNRPGTLLIDSKRMSGILEIDERNMYAVVEPYVSMAQLHSEANKRGLYLGSPEASAQSSALAGHCFQALWGVAHRLGHGQRNISAMEWVLPHGEILRTGSWAGGTAKPFFPEGPGTDLRGMLRGYAGTMGGVGMVTKMAVKLHPYPGPKEFPCEGMVPVQTSTLPPERFEWHIIKYPTLQKAADAMYEISKAEIGGVLQKWPTVYYDWWWAASNQEYWETWEKGIWQRYCKHAVAVCLWGFTSEKQLAYERRVLEDIIKDTKGKPIPQEIYDMWVPRTANNWIRDTSGPRMTRASGTFLALRLAMDTFDSSVKTCDAGTEWVDKFSPPILDCDGPDWISSYDFGHFGGAETDFPVEKSVEDLGDLMQRLMGMIKQDLARNIEGGIGPFLGAAYHGMAGSILYNYGALLKGIKKAIDPNVVSNPPQIYPVEEN